MSVVSKVDAFQRRHALLGYPLAVVYKFFDDQGPYQAALITYYAFLSIFPLLLLLSTILGYALAGDPSAQQAVLGSAIGQFPVISTYLSQTDRIGGSLAGVLIGSLGALYGALGVGNALQNAVNIAWAIPRNERPNPLKLRLRSVLLLVTAGLFVIGTTVLQQLNERAGRWLSATGALDSALFDASRVGALVLTVLGFALAFHLAAAHRPRFRTVLPGALGAALVWQVLQTFGARLVTEVIARASATNAIFGLVLGLFAFLFVAAVAVVMSVEADVVRVRGLHPRALLTPLTDRVQLTEADERAYAGMAQAQRFKGFEEVEVTFER
jgi:membrane protein